MRRGDETLTAFSGIRISIWGPSPAIWPIRVMGRMGTRMEGVFFMEGRMRFGSGTRQSVASQRDVPRYILEGGRGAGGAIRYNRVRYEGQKSLLRSMLRIVPQHKYLCFDGCIEGGYNSSTVQAAAR